MMNRLAAWLAASKGGVLLADGGTGTALQVRGLGPGECPEAWNLSHPDQVAETAAAYAAAGSELVYTNTFGGNRVALGHHGLGARVAAINAAGVHAARAGVGWRARVAGSIGPTGRLLEPLGELTVAEAEEAFREQAEVLAAAGVDALVLETFTDLTEARGATIAARAVMTGPVIVSLAFDRGARTVMGVSAEEAAPVLLAAGADALGANCGGEWGDVAGARAALALAAPEVPLLLKPNAGTPVASPSGTVYPQDPELFVRFMFETAARLPVRIAGGCCGTGTEHIAALRCLLSAGGHLG